MRPNKLYSCVAKSHKIHFDYISPSLSTVLAHIKSADTHMCFGTFYCCFDISVSFIAILLR